MAMSDGTFGFLMGILCGITLGALLFAALTPNDIVGAEKVAIQICEFLDTDLIDYESYGWKFEYIKCGDKRLIEGLDAEKLIEILE